jgi:hypothetical protein
MQQHEILDQITPAFAPPDAQDKSPGQRRAASKVRTK